MEHQARDIDDATDLLRLSRRRALGRIGQGGVAATALAALAVPRVAAQGSAQEGADEARAERAEDVVVPTTTRDALPDASPETTGRLRLLGDDDRGLWVETDGRWVSLRGEVFDVRAYGAVGDGVADDWGAFASAIEAMTSRLEVDSTSAYGRTLYVPPGTYRLAQTLVLDRSVRLVGAGAAGHTTDSILLFDEGVVGVLVAAADPAMTGGTGRRGDGAIVERLRIVSAPAPEGDPEAVSSTKQTVPAADPAALHGIWLRAPGSVRDLCVERFPGDGIHVEIGGSGMAESDGADDPAAHASWEVTGAWVAACGGHGLRVAGVAVGLAERVTVTGNGGWGIHDSGPGSVYVGCRAAENETGSFTTTGGANRGLVAGCVAETGQPRAVFADGTVIAAGAFADGFQGGNAWTADAARMLLRAQAPGGGDAPLPTVPTLAIRAAQGQTQPHLRIGDQRDGRLVEVDAAGRVLVGPVDLVPAPADGDAPGAEPVQLQISSSESGRAGVRWVVAGDPAAWVATARAYREAGGTDADPDGGGSRLTFQTAGAAGQEVDTLTLRDGRVGIGTPAPAGAAVLDLSSTAQGFLPPRMTSEQRDAIAGPPEGLTIFNTTTKRLNVHDGERWREVAFTEPVTGG